MLVKGSTSFSAALWLLKQLAGEVSCLDQEPSVFEPRKLEPVTISALRARRPAEVAGVQGVSDN